MPPDGGWIGDPVAEPHDGWGRPKGQVIVTGDSFNPVPPRSAVVVPRAKLPRAPRPATVDFESFGIEGRPAYPPVPVGVSIKKWGKRSRYYAWGHLGGKNNCTKAQAVAALREVWDGELLFHNARFDVDVAEVHLGLAVPPWERVHDTMLMLFLDDPHRRSIELKVVAEEMLGLPPEERDAVAEWLWQHQPVEGVKIGRAVKGKEPPGKYIAYAPGDVVAPYANGDVDRTVGLFEHLWVSLAERDMLPAYRREQRLLPILLDMERRGIAVDVDRLRQDIADYRRVYAQLDAWLYKRLGTDELNLDSGQQLTTVLIDLGLADPSLMGVTKTGKTKSDKKALKAGVSDKQLAAVLQYRSQLKTCLGTFMEPWLATAEVSGGLIFTHWNQTRGGDGGTRTGRLSSTPNFQNIPTEFKVIFDHEAPRTGLPKAPFKLPPLPQVRSYVTARKKKVLCGRDFSSQELRILAHFEDGDMLASYLADPTVDFHQHAADLVTKITGVVVTRKAAKTIGFAILYGSGVPSMAASLDVTVEVAKSLLRAYFQVFPGVEDLQRGLKARGKANQPIRTIGGREYHCEPPAFLDGRLRTFEYKLLNYLIQSSAADQTKDAMIRFYDALGPGYLLLSVHDELVFETSVKDKVKHMKALKAAMNFQTIDTPMLSDGEWGQTWATMEECSV